MRPFVDAVTGAYIPRMRMCCLPLGCVAMTSKILPVLYWVVMSWEVFSGLWMRQPLRAMIITPLVPCDPSLVYWAGVAIAWIFWRLRFHWLYSLNVSSSV